MHILIFLKCRCKYKIIIRSKNTNINVFSELYLPRIMISSQARQGGTAKLIPYFHNSEIDNFES